jgi:tagatose-1,6-bisphosphate aldolase
VNGVHWKDGIIHIDQQNGNTDKSHQQIKAPAFFLNNISATNTAVFFKNRNISASVFFSKLTAGNLTKRTDQPFELENLMVTGNNAKLALPDAKLQCNEFMVWDRQKSDLHDISFEQKTGKDTILISMPAFTFIPSIKETIETNKVTADSLSFYHPEIFLSVVNKEKGKTTGEKPSHFPKMDIKGFAIEDASVQVNTNNKNTKTVTNIKKISLSIKNVLTQKDNNISASAVLLDFNNAQFKKDDSITVNADGNLIASLNEFSFDASNQGWQARLDKLSLGSFQYAKSAKADKKSMMLMYGLSAENAIAISADLKQPLAWLFNHSDINISLNKLHWQNEGADLEVTGFRFNQQDKKATINSFSVDPGKSKDEFIKSLMYRKDYIEASSGSIAINGIELNDSKMRIPYMAVDHAMLNVYSDKLKKPGPETSQPLPVTAIKKIPIALQVDRIQLKEMKVGYTELNEETRQTGHVYFAHINGDVLNVSSKPNVDSDSVRISVVARFLDTMQLHLILNESYTGPSHGLRLQLQLGSGDARLFNSFLMPLTSMQVKSGFIDTMNMTALGNEYTSHGSMRMYYHDLKADKLDSGNTQHRRLGTKLMSFFASALAVKSNNSQRQADFSFVRIRQKSSISYLLTMVVQGAAGSVAPLTRIIYRKEYKKEMKKPAEQKEE